MNIYYNKIGMTNSESKQFEFQEFSESAEAYIRLLLKYTLDNKKTRAYKFTGENKVERSVCAFAQAVINPTDMDPVPDLDDLAYDIANKLVDAEGPQGMRIPTGSLVMAFVSDDEGQMYFVIAKVDHSRFFEAVNLTEQVGFSGENRDIWKTALILIENEPDVSVRDVLVFMASPAKYWTEGFLELEEARNDATNTRNMFVSVNSLLSSKLEQVSLNDYLILWNTLSHRVQTRTNIDYEDFICQTFDTYEPQNTELGDEFWQEIKQELKDLPEEKGFDRVFVPDTAYLGKRINKHKHKIAQGIELIVSDTVNIKERIEIGRENGNKYIKIFCDEDFVL